jgi:AraC family transcriptional regulator
MSQLQSHLRYRGSLVSITDVCCRPATLSISDVEQATVHEIVFPRAGVFVMHVGHSQIVADPNHVLFFNAKELYRVKHPVLGGDDCTSFTFPAEIVLDAVTSYDPRIRDHPEKPFRFNHVPIEAKTIIRQQQLRRRLSRPWTGSLEIEESALSLFHEVTRHLYRYWDIRRRWHRPETLRLHRQWVDSVKLLMAQRLRDNLSLAEIARLVHCSPFHLARLFRATTGFSIHQYQLRLRLVEAMECLVDGVASLTDLALDLGFSSHSHFSSTFQRSFGMSPSNFRSTATASGVRKLSRILKV